MSIDKKEDLREPSVDSMESTPEPEAGPSNPEQAEQPKRKGGRKPVCLGLRNLGHIVTDISRSMLLPKSASKEIDRLKQPSENVALNISSSWRKPSESMRRTFTASRPPTEVPRMSASC